MQINNNYNNNQQSFGMAYTKMWNSTQSVLKRRISNKDWPEFEKLISAQEKNKSTEISLYASGPSDNKLIATIRNGTEVTNMSERIFEGPLKFLKRVNKKADFIDTKIGKAPDKDDIFTKLK